MTCANAEILLQQLLDGRLSPAERRRLDSHLADCAACRTAGAEYRRLDQAAASWLRADDPGDDFTALVMAHIAARPAPARSLLWPRLALAGALLVALAVLSFFASPILPALPVHVGGFLSPLETFNALPGWLLANLSALPDDVWNVWNSLPTAEIAPRWLGLALLVACAVNFALLRAAQLSRRVSA